ncbi:hypothetical protein ACFQ06_06205, partial [Tessaracoccus lubricantis]
VGRRGLLIAGLGVAAVVAAGGIAAGVYGARTPMMSGPMTEEAWQEPVPVAPQPEPIDVGALEETFFTLQERGLTLVGEFAVDITGVSGTAMSPSAPGQLREFSKKTARPLVVAEATPGEVPPTVDLEALHAAVLEGMSRAPMDLGGDGYADRMELVFTQLGTPTVKVTVLTNDPASAAELGTAQYDMDGNLMALEENR